MTIYDRRLTRMRGRLARIRGRQTTDKSRLTIYDRRLTRRRGGLEPPPALRSQACGHQVRCCVTEAKKMFGLITCAALLTASSPSAQSPPDSSTGGQERVNLVRTYEEGEVNMYQFDLVSAAEGAETVGSADVLMKVEKKLDGGKAQMAINVGYVAWVLDGEEMPPQEIEPFTATFDKHSLPLPASIAGFEIAEMLFFIAFPGYVPGQEVKVGETYPIKWGSASSIRVEGTCKFEGAETIDGVKAAKLAVHMEISAEDDQPRTLDLTSYVSVRSGKLLKADGTVKIAWEGSYSVSVKLKKPPTDASGPRN